MKILDKIFGVLDETDDVIDNGKEVVRKQLIRYILTLMVLYILMTDFFYFMFLFSINLIWSPLTKLNLIELIILALILLIFLKIFLKKEFKDMKSVKKKIVERIKYLKEKIKLLDEKKVSYK